MPADQRPDRNAPRARAKPSGSGKVDAAETGGSEATTSGGIDSKLSPSVRKLATPERKMSIEDLQHDIHDSEMAVINDKAGDLGDGPLTLGVELVATELRMAIRAEGSAPEVTADDVFARTGLAAIGYHPWSFKTERNPETGNFEVSSDTAKVVSGAVQKFLHDLHIEAPRITCVNVASIISFDQFAMAQATNMDKLLTRLRSDFGIRISRINRTQASIDLEVRHGVSAPNLLYINVGRSLNIDLLAGGAACMSTLTKHGVYLRTFRHCPMDRDTLDQLGKQFIGNSYVAPAPTECPHCGEFCLHTIASGEGMAELLAREMDRLDAASVAKSPVVQAMEMRARSGRPFLHDRGAQIGVGPAALPVDNAAIFRAASVDETCRRIVLQAGIALGQAIIDKLLEAENDAQPNLVVLGGTVPRGSDDEDSLPARHRDTIDGMIRRLFLAREYDNIRVTRSRLSGFTGLLATTMSMYHS